MALGSTTLPANELRLKEGKSNAEIRMSIAHDISQNSGTYRAHPPQDLQRRNVDRAFPLIYPHGAPILEVTILCESIEEDAVNLCLHDKQHNSLAISLPK